MEIPLPCRHRPPMSASAFDGHKLVVLKRGQHNSKTLSEWSESGKRIDTHSPACVEANTMKVLGSLYQHLRVVRSIHEVFEIRPSGEVSRQIVIKNDPGAEMTLISPILYDWAKEKGLLCDEIIAEATKVSFTAGAGAAYINEGAATSLPTGPDDSYMVSSCAHA